MKKTIIYITIFCIGALLGYILGLFHIILLEIQKENRAKKAKRKIKTQSVKTIQKRKREKTKKKVVKKELDLQQYL